MTENIKYALNSTYEYGFKNIYKLTSILLSEISPAFKSSAYNYEFYDSNKEIIFDIKDGRTNTAYLFNNKDFNMDKQAFKSMIDAQVSYLKSKFSINSDGRYSFSIGDVNYDKFRNDMDVDALIKPIYNKILFLILLGFLSPYLKTVIQSSKKLSSIFNSRR